MTTRRFITTLLIIVLTLSGATRALASPRDDEDTKITPEEEREARELVEEFNKKFVETHDIAPLVKEYFVPDFSSRLQQHAETFPFQFIKWKDDATPPDPEDLLRFYVASTNFLHVLFPIYGAAVKKCAEEKDDDDAGDRDRDDECDDDHDPKLEKVLPPSAIEIIKSEPSLRDWLGSQESDTRKDEAGNKTDDSGAQQSAQPVEDAANKGEANLPAQECRDGCAKADDGSQPIENVEQLHHGTSLYEALSKILREHLAAHPVTFEKKGEAGDEPASEENDDVGRFDPGKITIFKNARVLEEEFYGYPEGTRIVCANVGMLHAELVRVDGRLRILTIYLLIED
jgi:hypothetical protein